MPPTPETDPRLSTPRTNPIRSLIPGVASTPRPSPNHPDPTRTPSPSANPFDPEAASYGPDSAGQPTPGPGSDGTRTANFFRGDRGEHAAPKAPKRVSTADVAKTVGSLLVLLAGVAGWLANRTGRELRPPTEAERAEVAEPVAAILVRHVGAEFLTDDLVDGIRAAAGVAAYVQTNPIKSPSRRRGIGEIPDDLDAPPSTSGAVQLEPI